MQHATQTNQPSIDALADQWLMMKQLIKSNQAELLRIEQSLIPLLNAREEGSATTHTPMGKKVVLKNAINYKLDGTKLLKVRQKIPEALLPLKVKELLDEPRLKYLRNNEPEVYAIFADAITATPAKPNVTVEVNEGV
jgi:hypothetical protein